MRAWIGLGSNLGDGPANVRRALDMLATERGVRVLRVSSLYRSPPWGVQDQPDFTNAVAELEVAHEAEQLLGVLQDIERRMGREKGPRWGPRIIDLDLLLAGDTVLLRPGLTVPHPRMHRRAFVLVPLAELEPDLPIPSRGTARSCLERLGAQEVVRMDAAKWPGTCQNSG